MQSAKDEIQMIYFYGVNAPFQNDKSEKLL